MKVILLRDVAKLGKKNFVADVPDGYAQNKLIPSGIALPATPVNLKRLEKMQVEHTAQTTADLEAFNGALQKLKTNPVSIEVETNAQGGLFQAVKAGDIAQAIVRSGIMGVPVEAIQLETPIKTVGTHQIPLSWSGATGECQLAVETKS